MKDVLQNLQPGMKVLAQHGLVAPTVGHELANQRGHVVAEAELAWPGGLLVVLRSDQADMESIWQDVGWRVLLLDAAGEKLADSSDWAAAVVQILHQITILEETLQ